MVVEQEHLGNLYCLKEGQDALVVARGDLWVWRVEAYKAVREISWRCFGGANWILGIRETW